LGHAAPQRLNHVNGAFLNLDVWASGNQWSNYMGARGKANVANSQAWGTGGRFWPLFRRSGCLILNVKENAKLFGRYSNKRNVTIVYCHENFEATIKVSEAMKNPAGKSLSTSGQPCIVGEYGSVYGSLVELSRVVRCDRAFTEANQLI